MEYLSTEDVSLDLGLNLRTIQKYIKEGFLPSAFTFRGSKKVYQISPKDYFNWKQTYFLGVKKGEINKFNRANKPLKLEEIYGLIDKWLEALKSGTLNGRVYSSTTIETYDYFIHDYLNKLGSNPYKALISKENLKNVLGQIASKQYATKQKTYDAVICFAKFLVEECKLSNEEREAIKTIKPRRFLPAKKVSLSEKQIEQVIDFSQQLTGNSDYDKLLTKTLVVVLKETGLRATKLCRLKHEDVDLEGKAIYVWHGKGNKNRKVGITNICYESLLDYITKSHDNESEYFFTNRFGEALTRNTLRLKWDKLYKYLGFKITTHSFRRFFITNNAAKGMPINHLRIACGHSDISTTQNYCTTTVDEVVEAMKKW